MEKRFYSLITLLILALQCALWCPATVMARSYDNVSGTLSWSVGDESSATATEGIVGAVLETSVTVGSDLVKTINEEYPALNIAAGTYCTYEPATPKAGCVDAVMIEYTVKMTEGVSFKPTSFEFDAVKVGTDRSYFSWNFTVDGRVSNINEYSDPNTQIRRDNNSNPDAPISHVESVNCYEGQVITLRLYISDVTTLSKKISIGNIKINGVVNSEGYGNPSETTGDGYRRTWDFCKGYSASTLEMMAQDTKHWVVRHTGFYNTANSDSQAVVTYNGEDILVPELEGLTLAMKYKEHLQIVSTPESGNVWPYGFPCLWINGRGTNVELVVPAGEHVKIGYSSHSQDEERGFIVSDGFTDAVGNTTFKSVADGTVHEERIFNSHTEESTLKLYSTGGHHIYYIIIGEGDNYLMLNVKMLAKFPVYNAEETQVSTEVIEAYETTRQACATASTYAEVKYNKANMEAAQADVEANIAAWKSYLEEIEAAKGIISNSQYIGKDVDILAEYVELQSEGIINGKALSTSQVIAETATVKQMNDNAMQNTVAAGTDLSGYIINPDFSNAWDGWGHKGLNGTVSAHSDYKCAEAWNSADIDVWQEIKDAPVGFYEVSAHGFYRRSRRDNAWNLYFDEATGQAKRLLPDTPVSLYSNYTKAPLANIFEYGVPESDTYYTNDYYTGPSYDGVGYTYPTSFSDVNLAFDHGEYNVSTYGLVAKEGDVLRIGVKGNTTQSGDSWAVFTRFRLTYLGNDVNLFKNKLEESIKAIDLTKLMGVEVRTQTQILVESGNSAIASGDAVALLQSLSDIYNNQKSYEQSVRLFDEVQENINLCKADLEQSEALEEVKAEAASYLEGLTLEGKTNAEAEAVDAAVTDYRYKLSIAAEKYVITYMSDGEVYHRDTLTYGSSVPAVAAPVKEGHTFSGWSPEVPETMPANDITVTAVWSGDAAEVIGDDVLYSHPGTRGNTIEWRDGAKMTITGNAGKTLDPALVIPYEADSYRSIKLSNGAENTFYCPEGKVATEVTFISYVNADAITKTSYWKEVAGVTYEESDVTPMKSAKDVDNPDINTYSLPNLSEFTFKNTGIQVCCLMKVKMVDATTVNDYVITYMSDGEVYRRDTLAYGSSVPAVAAPVKEGHTFSGWTPAVPETMPANDITVTAQWTANKYVITYLKEKLDEHKIPDLTGTWTFEQSYLGAKSVTMNLVLQEKGSDYATYKASGFYGVITFGCTVHSNRDISLALYALYGARGVFEGTFNEDFTSVSGDSYLYVPDNNNWAVSPWVVEEPWTFRANDDVPPYITDDMVYRRDTIACGSVVPEVTAPVKNGYRFSGWSPEVPETMPANNLIVAPIWEPALYNVTYIVADTVYNSTGTIVGDKIPAIPEPVRTGYTFAGWDGMPTDGVMPAGDLRLTAKWTVNSYKLTYIVDDEQLRVDEIPYGAAINPLTPEERLGCTFGGWDDLPEVMPAQDVEVRGYNHVIDTDSVALDGHLTDVMLAELNKLKQVRVLNIADVTDEAVAIGGLGSLQKASLPKTLTSYEGTLTDCPNLMEIVAEGTTEIPADAFSGSGTDANMIVYAPAGTDAQYAGNVVIGGIAENITLRDGLPLSISREFTASNISYTRNFVKTSYLYECAGWETIVLPFDVMEITNKGNILAPFYNGTAGVKNFWLAGLTTDGFGRASRIQANIPYIICMPNSEEYDDWYNISGDVTFSATNATVHRTADARVFSCKEFDLVPSYSTVEGGVTVYPLNDDEHDGHRAGSVFVSNLRDVRPFEAYARRSPSAPLRMMLSIGDMSPTGIMEVNAPGKAAGTENYDLLGRPTTSSHKGIRITRDSKGRRVVGCRF